MNKIKNILIVEDEALIADQLAVFAESAGFSVVDIVDEAETVFEVLQNKNVDLVFLDINLSGALDGIDIAHKINISYSIPFIYISSNTDPGTLKRMSITQPVSFITKPFQKEAISAALEIAQHQQLISKEMPSDATIFIKNGHVWERVDIKTIRYIEAQDNYVAIHLENERKMVLMSMKAIQEQLDSSQFLRVHRSFIVNKAYIDAIGPKFITIDTHEIPISASGKAEIMNKIPKLN